LKSSLGCCGQQGCVLRTPAGADRSAVVKRTEAQRVRRGLSSMTRLCGLGPADSGASSVESCAGTELSGWNPESVVCMKSVQGKATCHVFRIASGSLPNAPCHHLVRLRPTPECHLRLPVFAGGGLVRCSAVPLSHPIRPAAPAPHPQRGADAPRPTQACGFVDDAAHRACRFAPPWTTLMDSKLPTGIAHRTALRPQAPQTQLPV